jgi:hypothetical protein
LQAENLISIFVHPYPTAVNFQTAANIHFYLNPLDEKPKASRIQRLHNFLQCLLRCTERPK